MRAHLLITILLTIAHPDDRLAVQKPSEPVALEIELPEDAVLGFPLPARLVVHGEAMITSSGPFSMANPVALRLVGKSGTYRVPARDSYELRTSPDVHARAVSVPYLQDLIPAGERNSYLLDLSDRSLVRDDEPERGRIVRFDELPAGVYTLELAEPGYRLAGTPPTINLRPPTKPEARVLEKVLSVAESDQRWLSFVRRADRVLPELELDDLTRDAREQIGYVILLARIVHSREQPESLDAFEVDLRSISHLYADELLQLRWEMAAAAGRTPEAKERLAELRARRPVTASHLERQQTGLIEFLRRSVRSPDEKEQTDPSQQKPEIGGGQ